MNTPTREYEAYGVETLDGVATKSHTKEGEPVGKRPQQALAELLIAVLGTGAVAARYLFWSVFLVRGRVLLLGEGCSSVLES